MPARETLDVNGTAVSVSNLGKVLSFESKQVLQRVARWGDLFAPVLSLRQKLPSLKAIG